VEGKPEENNTSGIRGRANGLKAGEFKVEIK
jgi:hypothetical protein